MIAKLKVRKVGNSLGVILPNELLAKLEVGEDDSIFAVEEAEGIRLTPYDPDFERGMAIYERGRNKYRNTLRALAQGAGEKTTLDEAGPPSAR
jgi:putative addiction module antidote